MDVEFDGDLWPAGTDITVGTGGVQDTGHQELLAQVGMLVEEDLGGNLKNNKKDIGQTHSQQ